MSQSVHIVIAEPSTIIRLGLISLLHRASNINFEIAELSDVTLIADELRSLQPDVIIINPAHLGLFPPSQLREHCENLRVVALQSSLSDHNTIKSYDEVISIYDSAESICATIGRIVNNTDVVEVRCELSQREKEIVVCVAKGMANKEIADHLSLSTHTVISHRRNITTKLDIYSPSGLTIYAIVNKLIDIDSIPAK